MITYTKPSKQHLMDLTKENLESLILGFGIFLVILIGIVHTIASHNMTALSKKTTGHMQTKIIPTVSPITYMVKGGDNISTIALTYFGTTDRIQDIIKANNLTDPNNLSEGQVLVIPTTIPMQTIAPTPTVTMIPTPTGDIMSTGASTEVTFKGNEYTVQEGDSLSTIAQKAYGDENQWTRIKEANQLYAADSIATGMKLKIPRK